MFLYLMTYFINRQYFLSNDFHVDFNPDEFIVVGKIAIYEVITSQFPC